MRYLLSAILIWSAMTVSLQAKSPILHSKIEPKIGPDAIPVKVNKGVPHEINYQGWLGSATDTTGITDILNMQFRLYDAETGGTMLWNETQNNVVVDKGIFNVILGSVTPLPADIFTGAPLWLETQVTTDTFSPRKKLVSVGYAIKAERADTAQYAVTAASADTDWIISGDNMYSGVSGNVGIGTTSPGSGFNTKFDVVGSSSFKTNTGDITKALKVDAIGTRHRIYTDATSGTPYDLILGTYPNGHSNQLVLQQSTGNVGIGTTSPATKLHVSGGDILTDNGQYHAGKKTDGTIIALVGVGPSNEVYLGQVGGTAAKVNFYNNGSTRMTIDMAGNVGIGTTNPSEKLHVEGNATVTGNLTANGVSMSRIYLTSSGTIITTDGGTRELYWDETNGEIELTNTSGDWCDYWWQAQKGATTSGGSGATATGTSNVVIISGTNTNDHGFEVHFGQADGQEGWCSVWLQYANTGLVGHYIKY